MIPKTIHYCWFGGNPLPELALKCIESWKKYCPDYEIVCWNERNYDLNKKCVYVKEAVEEKKWAFVSDYARLDVIYNHGGIYLDTDVELISSLDDFLKDKCFLGMETSGVIATGLGFGAVKNSEAIRKMIDEYEGIHFRFASGIFDTTPCPRRNTAPFWEEGYKDDYTGIQYLKSATVYPPEYFCPLDYKTNKMKITSNTKSIHHFSASWISEADKEIDKLVKEYAKKHNKLITLMYKNSLEYKLKKRDENMNLFGYLLKKIKRKYLKRHQMVKR